MQAVASSESKRIRNITEGGGELARRLRASILGGEAQGQAGLGTIVERTFPPEGRRFPGSVHVPPTDPGDEKRQERIDRAVLFAKDFESDDTAYWTDGSAFPGGVAAGAVVTFVRKRELAVSEVQRTEVIRRGIVGCDRYGAKEGKRRRERTYKEATRSVVRAGDEGGMRAEAWTIKGGATAFDAELSALVRAVELCFLRRAPGVHFRIFTDSQAAMRRILDDRPGPGQAMAIRGIIAATRTHRRGASISVHWVPGHTGVTGNEVADQWASEAATRELGTSRDALSGLIRLDHGSTTTSKSFLRATLRRRGMDSWREEIIRKRKAGRQYRVSAAGEVPKIPTALQRVRKSLASRFFQLASGHAMTAPFLRDKFGWMESDQCWWCGSGRQSREHLFKECRTWKDQIRKLWKKIGEASGEAKHRTYRGCHKTRGRGKGFGV